MQELGAFILIIQALKCSHNDFSFSWQQKHFHAFPPFSCIEQVINKIELESATGILAVPLFTTQPWFTRLLRIFQMKHYCYQNLILAYIFHTGSEIRQTFPIFD